MEDGQVVAADTARPATDGKPAAPASDDPSAAADAATAKAARRARAAAKAEKRAARDEAKAAAKAAKRVAKAERKAAAKAERKAAKAARTAEKTARKAAKDAARAERKAAKDAARAARTDEEMAARAESKAVRAAARARRKAAKAELRSSEETRQAEAAAQAHDAAVAVADDAGRSAATVTAAPPPEALPANAPAEIEAGEIEAGEVVAADAPTSDELAPEVAPAEDVASPPSESPAASELTDHEPRPAASAMLEEVADLVRQTAAPPAERIVERVRPPDAPSVPPGSGRSRPGDVTGDTEPPEAAPGAIVAAAVDVGSNSAHLLVAAAGGHQVHPVLDESVFLGLGDRVSASGYMGSTARADVLAALTGYAETARRLGARHIVMVGTEPLRRAADTAALAHAVELAAGVSVHVLDHDEEAMLTLLGVTLGRPLRARELIVDIGGGSSELVLAGRAGVELALGIRLGCATLTFDLSPSDPPTLREIEAMRRTARETLAEAPDLDVSEMVAVGGTASNLLKLMPSTSLDRVLTRRRIAVTLAMLSVQHSTEAAERHLIRPERARILPAGAAIMDAFLERYGIGRVHVVEEGIREGAVLAAAAAGAAWRDRLPALARGWSDGASRRA